MPKINIDYDKISLKFLIVKDLQEKFTYEGISENDLNIDFSDENININVKLVLD